MNDVRPPRRVVLRRWQVAVCYNEGELSAWGRDEARAMVIGALHHWADQMNEAADGLIVLVVH